MREWKVWCWQMAQSGPDWIFTATVAPESAAALDQIATATTLPGYTACTIDAEYCQIHQQVCQYHTCIDTSNVEAYTSAITSEETPNIWVYNRVRIHRGSVEIDCGYGGRGYRYNQIETSFLLRVFSALQISLASWNILAGGQGYATSVLQAGTGLGSLSLYLAHDTV